VKTVFNSAKTTGDPKEIADGQARVFAQQGRTGFTLFEVIIAVAIVAIMAGAIAPVVHHEINRARSDATVKELSTLQKGLLGFYEDTGRFPSEDEGLPALVADPGIDNWQGPYISGGQADALSAVVTDAFGEPYVYDLDPRTDAGNVDALVVSPGVNHETDSGRLNRRWRVTQDSDDLYVLISTGPVNRTKEIHSRAEMQAIAAASRLFYRDHASFPANLDDLMGNYLDAGFGNEVYRDAWNMPYQLSESGRGPATTLSILSFGPDREDDRGRRDDLEVEVSSIPPGRATTRFELEIAQNALNANADLPLAGSWEGNNGIRSQLGLSEIFDLDGWGTLYGVDSESRLIYSAGPDGRPRTHDDNIPVGVGK
jgi:general secretion pathway protein G